METQAKNSNTSAAIRNFDSTDNFTGLVRHEFINTATNDFNSFLQNKKSPGIEELLNRLVPNTGKKNFLVFKNQKYINVPTENIAFFYIKYGLSFIICFDKQEYMVNYSLDQIQNLVTDKQFFRLNRQYLINFNAVKEVEHYFARKMLVNTVIPAKDKLIVSKEKVTEFLSWLDNR